MYGPGADIQIRDSAAHIKIKIDGVLFHAQQLLVNDRYGLESNFDVLSFFFDPSDVAIDRPLESMLRWFLKCLKSFIPADKGWECL